MKNNILRALQVILLLLVVQGIYSLGVRFVLSPFIAAGGAEESTPEWLLVVGELGVVIILLVAIVFLEKYRNKDNVNKINMSTLAQVNTSQTLRTVLLISGGIAILATTVLAISIFILPFFIS